MIRARRVPPLLSRAAGHGIYRVLLLDSDGEILGHYDDEGDGAGLDAAAAGRKERIMAVGAAALGSIVTNVVGDYDRAGYDLLGMGAAGPLGSLVVETDAARIGVSSAGGGYYVVCVADVTAELGLVRSRLAALGQHVGESLSLLR
mmetsp:Transcript_14905/g.29765  ORF Transcript_14905/g.29765 Transcript_14905/m.29765 type:complete len:146 (-) Transcript_14905:192-629(-)